MFLIVLALVNDNNTDLHERTNDKDKSRSSHFSSYRCVQSNIVLLTQAFRKKFVIPDFQSFTSHIDQIYEGAKSMSGGQVRLEDNRTQFEFLMLFAYKYFYILFWHFFV